MRLTLKRQTFDIAAIALGLGLASVTAAHAEAVSLPLHHAMRVNTHGAATAVVVGDPSVADVTVVDSRTMFITGRSYGGTNVIALDRYGQTVFTGDIIVVAPATAVKVYRGGARTDLACAPSCSPLAPLQAASAGTGEAPSSAATVASGVAGANVAAGVVGNAMKPSGAPPAQSGGMVGPGPS